MGNDRRPESMRRCGPLARRSIISDADGQGKLHSMDWDKEPLPDIHSAASLGPDRLATRYVRNPCMCACSHTLLSHVVSIICDMRRAYETWHHSAAVALVHHRPPWTIYCTPFCPHPFYSSVDMSVAHVSTHGALAFADKL